MARGYWLEHIFVLPEHIGKGIGTLLVSHAKEEAGKLNCAVLRIFADSYAKGFYEKIGARFIRDVPSSIKGRSIPYFELPIRSGHMTV